MSDLDRSFRFYTDALGLQPVARWVRGAYLMAGEDWICLTLDEATREGPLPEYTHVAFTVGAATFAECAGRLIEHGVTTWKENESEGASLYFLDPDGHKLELHAGSLRSRLAALRQAPYEGLELFL